jgi:hypothetical protein
VEKKIQLVMLMRDVKGKAVTMALTENENIYVGHNVMVDINLFMVLNIKYINCIIYDTRWFLNY